MAVVLHLSRAFPSKAGRETLWVSRVVALTRHTLLIGMKEEDVKRMRGITKKSDVIHNIISTPANLL